MSLRLDFVELDVFTSKPFLGNPLAIVLIPYGTEPIPQEQKQLIAREFNLSETAFIHQHGSTSDSDKCPFVVDIFTPYAELPFAGHPTIGSGWYLLQRFPERDFIILRTKAGDIPVTRVKGTNSISLQVPVDFKIHEPQVDPSFKTQQLRLSKEDYRHGIDGPEQVVSIVKGMTFQFLELASVEALGRLEALIGELKLPPTTGKEWIGACVCLYAFCVLNPIDDDVLRVRARLFDGALEDPATGSAASALGGYLAQKKGRGTWRVEIQQGIEMGRESNIGVQVTIGEQSEVSKIELSGDAVDVMEGKIRL
jgi:PhzF family phenazine biosynthesis protein